MRCAHLPLSSSTSSFLTSHLEAGGDFADTNMLEYLPARFAPKCDRLFAKEFIICLGTVVSKLVQPGNWPLACVGEELALIALIEDAEVILHEREESGSEFKDRKRGRKAREAYAPQGPMIEL
ncbi:MAG: hypothetical protein ACR2NT_01950 [Acidimicrobiia bacterium]